MFNTAISEHTKYSDRCRTPQFTVQKELQKGMVWKMALACQGCSYATELHQLYDTVPAKGRGAKAAAVNLGLQVGLLDSPMGNTKAQVLVASLNTPPPSRSSMAASSRIVCARTLTEAEADLRRRRE